MFQEEEVACLECPASCVTWQPSLVFSLAVAEMRACDHLAQAPLPRGEALTR